VLIGLKVLGSGEELLLVSEKGVIVRMQADAVPQQSRAATGVRLQRLDAGDRLAEVVLVPPAAPGEEAPATAVADAPVEGQTPADAEALAHEEALVSEEVVDEREDDSAED
jgi:DNA gyrase subunit A